MAISGPTRDLKKRPSTTNQHPAFPRGAIWNLQPLDHFSCSEASFSRILLQPLTSQISVLRKNRNSICGSVFWFLAWPAFFVCPFAGERFSARQWEAETVPNRSHAHSWLYRCRGPGSRVGGWGGYNSTTTYWSSDTPLGRWPGEFVDLLLIDALIYLLISLLLIGFWWSICWSSRCWSIVDLFVDILIVEICTDL